MQVMSQVLRWSCRTCGSTYNLPQSCLDSPNQNDVTAKVACRTTIVGKNLFAQRGLAAGAGSILPNLHSGVVVDAGA